MLIFAPKPRRRLLKSFVDAVVTGRDHLLQRCGDNIIDKHIDIVTFNPT